LTALPDMAAFEAALAKMSKRDLVAMAKAQKELQRRLAQDGPKTDDELHAWIKLHLGIDIPRMPVCAGHTSPFQFLADLYFWRTTSAVAMANRGGSKTFLVALLHYLNSNFRPGIESCSVGAIEMQARRAYMHMQKLLDKRGSENVLSSTMIDTRWKNGSRVEVLPGTIAAVNGPHPAVVHVDEVELMDPEVFDESRNMSAASVVGSTIYPAQDIITSTRKRGHGPMQKLIDSITDAEAKGFEPPYKLYTWCVFEVAAEVKNCQYADPNVAEPCPCKRVSGGTDAEGHERSLYDTCQGRFARSRGFLPLDDIINTYTKASPEIWAAQQECSRPSSEGLVVPYFNAQRHGIRSWDPHPEYGQVFMSVDFGATAPHSVHWYQDLRVDVDSQWGNEVRHIPEGSVVCFDEIYQANISNTALADLIVQKERAWRRKHRGFNVSYRFYDPAAKNGQLQFAAHTPPLRLVRYMTREVEEHIKLINEAVSHNLFYVDLERCPMFVEEIEDWHRDRNNDKIVEDFDHAMSDFRYFYANLSAIKRGKKGGPKTGPSSRKHKTVVNMGVDPVTRRIWAGVR
jgi:hypothetical protein